MSDAIDIQVDYTEFNQALNDYVQATGKSMADALNRCAKNIAIQSLKHCRTANGSEITNLKQAENFMWWLAWKIKNKEDGELRSNKYQSKQFFLRTGVQLKGMKRKDAYKRAVKAINKRKSSVGFMRAFFAEMSRAIDGQGSGKKFSGIIPTFFKASSEMQRAEIGAQFDYKRDKQTANAGENILWGALQSGVTYAAKDMREYIFKKMNEAGVKYGAK